MKSVAISYGVFSHPRTATMSSSGSTYIPWNKLREPVPEGMQVPMCFCGSLCKLMKSKVLGDFFGMRFFMCENYAHDPPKRRGQDKPKVRHECNVCSYGFDSNL